MNRELLLDDFDKKDMDYRSDLVQEALIDLGYDNVKSYSYQLKVQMEYE